MAPDNPAEKPLLNPLPVSPREPHQFAPHRKPEYQGCIKCGKIKDNDVHRVRIRIKNG